MSRDVDWTLDPVTGDLLCEHGVAIDIHCCNCHNGFAFLNTPHDDGCPLATFSKPPPVLG